MADRPCPECGSTQVLRGLSLDQQADAGRLGLSYHAVGIFRGTEPLVADLCQECGTVVRMYVQNPDRKWVR